MEIKIFSGAILRLKINSLNLFFPLYIKMHMLSGILLLSTVGILIATLVILNKKKKEKYCVDISGGFKNSCRCESGCVADK